MPSDRDASISDAAFREALEEYGDTRATYEDNPCQVHYKAIHAARARVLALYNERQGEEFQVENDEGGAPVICLPDEYFAFQRVLVTKVEEGT